MLEIKREVIKMGNDYVILIQNENGHIGSVVTAYPCIRNGHETCSYNVINTLGHKDDEVAIRYASRICKNTRQVVTCICGIHYDDITKDQIQEVLNYIENDIDELEKEVSHNL